MPAERFAQPPPATKRNQPEAVVGNGEPAPSAPRLAKAGEVQPDSWKAETPAVSPGPTPQREEQLTDAESESLDAISAEDSAELSPLAQLRSSVEPRLENEPTAAPGGRPAPKSGTQGAESSRFAVRADPASLLSCDDLEARARRLEQDAADRVPLLLASADCQREQRPERALDLYLEVGELDAELGAAVRQRLTELQRSPELSPSARNRIQRWIESH